jgi:hypothetical protein
MKGDGSKRMRGEFLNYVSEHAQVGLKVWNGGNVLGLRKGDGDVEEQRISLARMVRALGPGSKNIDAVTIVSTAKRAHARLVEFIAVLMKANDQLDPNIVSISSLDNMQNSYGTDPMVDHEDIFRGAWKSEFCPPPHFESRMMLPVRDILGPIGTIHTGFDLVVVAGRGFIVLMAMTPEQGVRANPP